MRPKLFGVVLIVWFLVFAVPGFGGPATEDPDLPEILAQKVAKLPPEIRRKTIFIESTPDGFQVAGKGSVINSIIQKAGGLSPDGLGALEFEPLTLTLWQKLAPEVVIARTKDLAAAKKFLGQRTWRNSPAVKNNQIFDFPDGLVDVAKDHQTYFSAWLAGTLYAKEFGQSKNLVRPEAKLSSKPLKLEMPYVENATIVDSRILDFVHRSLVIRFKKPLDVISTSAGPLQDVEAVGNSYSPAPTWPIYHQGNFDTSMAKLYEVLGLNKEKASLLGTGADLNNLVVTTRKYKDLVVTTLITAGVEGNAIRAGSDEGAFVEPGTINIIVLANRRLTPGAMANAIIYVTEAKTAALWEMDIRSVQTGLENPATGTGTDSIVVVSGEGKKATWSGGHAKLGQLIAESVKAGVIEAIYKQNGKTPQRSVQKRLAERGQYCPELSPLFDIPRYQGFMEMAFSLSDAHRFGQAIDLTAFESLALIVAGEIAGKPILKLEDAPKGDKTPAPLSIALRALKTGQKNRKP
ncbi:MAG: adenosylcobinamide amidohydrolase [Deltaproteobacteria bacterium]|jgi:adenosylcobinamide amidohydrolase|nr:adenosylcobinamide amidohydrolase [Deltaproteobacteria bacterium]